MRAAALAEVGVAESSLGVHKELFFVHAVELPLLDPSAVEREEEIIQMLHRDLCANLTAAAVDQVWKPKEEVRLSTLTCRTRSHSRQSWS